MLPRTSIEKLLRDVIPSDISIQKEIIDWVNEGATEFLRLLSERANQLAEAESTKEQYSLQAKHVIDALLELNKPEYVKAIEQNQERALPGDEKKKKRLKMKKAKKAALANISHEELVAEQNALLQQASQQAARDGW